MLEKNITEEWSDVPGETCSALFAYYVPCAGLAILMHKHLIVTTILGSKYWCLLFYIRNWSLEGARRAKVTEVARHIVGIRNQIQSVNKYLLSVYYVPGLYEALRIEY